jgi:hypothetical protein
LVAQGYKRAKGLKKGISTSTTQNASSRDLYDKENSSKDEKKIEVFERWGLLKGKLLQNMQKELGGDTDGFDDPDLDIETVITMARDGAGKCIILRAILNPYNEKRPFFAGYFRKNPTPNRLYGIGIAIASNLQNGINNTNNMMLDNMVLANNPPHYRRRGARIDPRQLVYKPA